MKLSIFSFLTMLIASSTFLVITPAVASDYTLGIFGNANMDGTIDEEDIAYVEGIIEGTNAATELADANYNGRIDKDDITQIELIISGEDKELTIIDSADRIVTVNKPVDGIVIVNRNVLETLRSLKATDKIAGVTSSVTTDTIFFPEFSEFPNVGSQKNPDIETILELHPDVVFLYATQWDDQIEGIQNILHDADPSIAVVAFDCYKPAWYIDEVKKLGYILDRREESEEFVDFYQGCKRPIAEIVEGISEDDKPKVCILRDFYTTYGVLSAEHQMVVTAGGNDIFGDISGTGADVDGEEVITRDPEFTIWIHRWDGGYLLDAEDTAELEVLRTNIMTRPELRNVTAVERENVYVVTNDVYRGARDFVGIAYMAKWFHPDLFEDLDPQALHQEYLTRFQGLDYDLNDLGVFVYPEV
jgi:iron complex transport system substrate-binding protein